MPQSIKQEANQVYRDGTTADPNEPLKSEIRSLFGTIANVIEALKTLAEAGLEWVDGGWQTATAYTRNQALTHNGVAYRCISDHTSSSATEPGIGGSWESRWEIILSGIGAQLDIILKRASPAGVASAATVNLGETPDFFIDITGTATISSFGTTPRILRLARFTSTPTLVHSSALSLPGNANIAVQAGDVALFASLGNGDWVCMTYLRKSGKTVVPLIAADVTNAEIPTTSTVDNAWIEGFGVPQKAVADSIRRVFDAVDARGRDWTFSDSQLVMKGRPNHDFDLVIYGGSLSAVMAARRAKIRGLRVAIVDPYPHLGGVLTNGGLIFTDFPSPVARATLVRGLTRQFFHTIHTFYDDPVAAKGYVSGTNQWLREFDPRPARKAFNLWARDVDLVVNSSPIFAAGDVRQRSDRGITAIRTAIGWITGRVFIDASNEGDLIRASEASFRLGRESQAQTGEPAAGFKPAPNGASRLNGFTTPPDGIIVEPQSSVAGLSAGDADDRIQTLSIRSLVTQASYREPFTPPPDYDKEDYKIAGEGAMLWEYDTFTGLTGNSAVGYHGPLRLKDGEIAANTNNGTRAIVSNERGHVGWDYANANWARRREIAEEQNHWQRGLFYYLANDLTSHWDTPSTQALQASAASWGMVPDAYPDSPWHQGWPNNVYVRESLRLEARYVMTQADLYATDSTVAPVGYDRGTRNNIKSGRIARWSYFLDAHACRIYEDPELAGRFVFEGGVANPLGHEVDPYDIPFDSLRTDQTTPAVHVPNLLVSVCIGVTHVAWMPTRMEPCFAMMGEACGEAAGLMIENRLSDARDVNVTTLRERLNQYGSGL